MSEVIGIKSPVDVSESGGMAEPGHYVYWPPHGASRTDRVRTERTRLRCPFGCGRWLRAPVRAWRVAGRVAYLVDDTAHDGQQRAIFEPLPPGFRLVFCDPCHGHFVASVRQLRGEGVRWTTDRTAGHFAKRPHNRVASTR
jgi:hypothetical protein